ncbi:MAG: hypothetical protein WB610_10755 [Rhodomicrobium sp.]|jgi:hypothetical protein
MLSRQPTVKEQPPKKASSEMGFIKAIFYLVILGILAVAGYWFYGALSTSGDAPYWTEINKVLPEQARNFACEQIKKRASGHIESCD